MLIPAVRKVLEAAPENTLDLLFQLKETLRVDNSETTTGYFFLQHLTHLWCITTFVGWWGVILNRDATLAALPWTNAHSCL